MSQLQKWVAIFLGASTAIGLTGCGSSEPRAADSARAAFEFDAADPYTGWYRMQSGTLIPVFKRDGVTYSACRGFEIPFRPTVEGIEWALEPSSMVGTTIGRTEPGMYYIRIVDRQLASFIEDYIPGEAQPLQKIDPTFELPDPTAPAPRQLDDFLGWYVPVFFPWVKLEVRKTDETYSTTYHEMHKPDTWMPDGPKTRAVLADRLGITLDGKEARLIYNEALRRFEIVLGSDDNPLRNPLKRISPDMELKLPRSEIGIPSWH